VRVVPDPIRGAPHLLIMTEVLSPNGEPHPTNTRSPLEAIINDNVAKEAPLFGFEQEYTMLQKVCVAKQSCMSTRFATAGFIEEMTLPHPQQQQALGTIKILWGFM
jgi:glutamine synthetase